MPVSLATTSPGGCTVLTSEDLCVRLHNNHIFLVGRMQIGYFDVFNGFAAIGGISLMIYFFVSIAMLQCEAGKTTRYRVQL
jgi:hypothetical protein